MKIRSRRTLSILLTLALLISLLPAAAMPAAALDAADPDLDPGSETNPYRIGTAADLKEFRDIVGGTHATVEKNAGACAVLTANIDLENEVWTPIGEYEGIFDGAGHAITGLNVSGDPESAGLFGVISGGTVQDLSVSGSVRSERSGEVYAGGIVGWVKSGTVRGCSFTGTVTANSSGTDMANAGGIAGRLNYSDITGCSFTGTVTASNSGTGSARAGGIAGAAESDDDDRYYVINISECRSEAAVSATAAGAKDAAAGGILGLGVGSKAWYVEEDEYDNDDYNYLLKCWNCVNAGSVSAANSGAGNAYCGGITGKCSYGNIKFCYSTGTVTGGIVESDTRCRISDCYYLTGSGKGTLLTEDAFKVEASFSGWDFNGVWYMGAERPELWAFARQAGSWSELHSALDQGVAVRLRADVEFGDGDSALSVPSGKTAWLDLAGHIVDRNGRYDTPLLTVEGTLTLSDSAADQDHGDAVSYTDPITKETVSVSGGVLTGNHNIGNGGGVLVKGTFTMRSGTICGNYGSMGGGVFVETGTFHMRGGAIRGNTAGTGAGVYVKTDGTFDLDGGSIQGNAAGVHAGGMMVYGTVNLRGGSIQNNTAEDGGGGVYMQSSCTFNISGSPVVTKNRSNDADNNLYLPGGTIFIDGDLTPYEVRSGVGARIGITTKAVPTEDSPAYFSETLSGKSTERNFVSDNESYIVMLTDGRGSLRLKPAGAGTEEAPYCLGSADDLFRFAHIVNGEEPGAWAVLTEDIDLDGAAWTPIGNDYAHSYTGTFDGQGHAITGLNVTGSWDCAGLFGRLGTEKKPATVQNLRVFGSVSTQNREVNAGGIAGCIFNGTVRRCTFDGPVSGTSGGGQTTCTVGGIAGSAFGAVSDCAHSGAVSAKSEYNAYAGGIVGAVADSKISNCAHSSGTVSATGTSNLVFAGGVVGNVNYLGEAESCFYLIGAADKGIGHDVNGAGSTSTEDGTAALTAEQFKQQERFEKWDFTNVWYMGDTRPELRAAVSLSGAGTATDPYRIGTAAELKQFRDIVSGTGGYSGNAAACAVLTKDIDLGGIDADGKGVAANKWTPIGLDHGHSYTGVFDGAGHTVTGLYVSGDLQYAGLFGYVWENGAIQNLGVSGSVSVTRSGAVYAGGVAGSVYDGTVRCCKFSGAVSGVNDSTSGSDGVYVGGGVGSSTSSTVTDCIHCDGGVSGDSAYSAFVGGVVGRNSHGTVASCAHRGGSVSAKGTGSDVYAGGAVGENVNQGAVTNCFFLTGAADAGIGRDATGTGSAAALTAEKFKQRESFEKWDFTNVWYMGAEGPELQAMATLAGAGTAADPYQIGTAALLRKFANIVNGANGETTNTAACAVLTADIDLGGIDADGKGVEANKWTPIGVDDSHIFSGVFDGAGHTVSGMYVHLESSSQSTLYAGLFGVIKDGTVQDLRVRGSVSLEATAPADLNVLSALAGGIVGNCSTGSTLLRCAFSGTVTSSAENQNQGDCFTFANVGGIAGYNAGTITNCAHSGAVGSIAEAQSELYVGSYVGGVTGENRGTVAYCRHSDGAVTSNKDADTGGVAGINYYDTVTNCYYLDGRDNGVGSKLTAEQFKDPESFENWDFSNVWYMDAEGPELWAFAAQAGSWSELADALIQGGAVRLTADVKHGEGEDSLTVPAGKTAVLDLAGHVVDRGGTAETTSSSVIKVNGALTLTDSAPDAAHATPITYKDPDTGKDVTVTGGVLTGGYDEGNGGGVVVDGTFTMLGGTICGNRAMFGGGVYINAGKTFTMLGGSVRNNTASSSGGGVFSDVNGTFCLGGGGIRDNVSPNGGVKISSDAGFELFGAPVVTGNRTADGHAWDVFLSNPITVKDALTPYDAAAGTGARIGVTPLDIPTAENPVTITSGLSGKGTAANFFSDDDRCIVVLSGGEATLRDKPDGSGTATDPYRLGSAGDLRTFAEIVNSVDAGACAVLTADVDLGNEAWTPIGADNNHAYTGAFDGAGHTVSGLNVKLEGAENTLNYAGLFGAVGADGTVRNLTVRGAVSLDYLGDQACIYVGGVAGWCAGRIESCASGVSVSGKNQTASGPDAYVGGVAGFLALNGTVSNCRSDGTVRAEIATGSIQSTDRACAGGIVGLVNTGTVTDCCHYSGEITAVADGQGTPRCGGVIGTTSGTVTGCYYLEGTAKTGIGYGEGSAAGLSAENFKEQSSFPGWDFNTVWYMGADAPELWAFAQQAGSWSELADALGKGGAVRLTADVKYGEGEDTLDVPAGKTALLDLAGHVVDRGGTAETASGSVLTVNGALTLTDSAPDAAHATPITYKDPDTGKDVTVTGGVITGGYYEAIDIHYNGNGGGVFVKGTFTMLGGTVCGNRAEYGGGVFVDSGKTFTMLGGSIRNNIAYRGGGVSLIDVGTFRLGGGSILHNSAPDGGGVFVSSDSMIKLSGVPVVTGNRSGDYASDVYSLGQNTIAVTGTLDKDARIGIRTLVVPSATTPVTFTSGLSGKGTAENFFSDDERFIVVLSDGEAALAVPTDVTVTFLKNDGTDAKKTQTVPYNTETALDANAFRRDGYDFAGWCTVASPSAAQPGTTYADKAGVKLKADLTLYAQWKKQGTVAAPVFSPAAGTYTGAQSVTISCATEGATVYYVANDTEPAAVYSGAITVAEDTTLKAWAVKAGMIASDDVTAAYVIAAEPAPPTPEQVAAPVFSPAAGTYTGAQSVTISCATEGATVYYVANDTEPAAVYSGAITVAEDMTLKAWAEKTGMIASDSVSAAYIIATEPAPPTPTVYSVTVTNDGHGAASASPASGETGTEVTLTATPAQGYHFKEWQVVSGGVTVADGKLTIGTANVEVKAVFEADPEPEPYYEDETPAPAAPAQEVVTDTVKDPDGTVTEKKTETSETHNPDGSTTTTVTETEVVTAPDGTVTASQTETAETTMPDGSTVTTVTETEVVTAADGSRSETVRETQTTVQTDPDGGTVTTVTETEVVTAADGSRSETVRETQTTVQTDPDGSTVTTVTETEVVTAADGSRSETVRETQTTVQTDPDGGTVTAVTETEVVTAADKTVTETETVTTETLDADGNGTLESTTTETVRDQSGYVTQVTETVRVGTVETADDGTKTTVAKVTATVTGTDGVTDTTITEETSVEKADGCTGCTVRDERGETISATATVSSQAVEEAVANGGAVTLPVEVRASEDAAEAAEIDITLPETDAPVKVLIPVENMSAGTVAVIVYPDGTEEIVKNCVGSDEGVALKLSEGAVVKIVDNAKDFPDVEEDDWFAEAVDFVTSRELFVGTGEGFEPDETMSRAMLATVLFRLDGAEAPGGSPFGDVPEDAWYADAATWAAEAGIITGTGNGFEPDAPVTREQIAVMFWRYAGYLGLDVSGSAPLDGFTDGGDVDDWAQAAMQWAVSVGLFQGDDNGALDPQGEATRAEVAVLCERMIKLL